MSVRFILVGMDQISKIDYITELHHDVQTLF